MRNQATLSLTGWVMLALASVTATAAPGDTALVSTALPGEPPGHSGFEWGSGDPGMSADGRYVVYQSFAADLVAGDTNGRIDIFLYDRQIDTTVRVSVASDGTQANSDSRAPQISAGGRYITFLSSASNLVAGDTNNSSDTFLHDRVTGITERISVGSSGVQGNAESYDGSVSSDGRYVAFSSAASNLVANDTNGAADIFLRDRLNGTTRAVARGNRKSDDPALTPDGRYVAFLSSASNLVAGDTNSANDVFVADLQSGNIQRVSLSSAGAQATAAGFDTSSGAVLLSEYVSISDDGRYVAFLSYADNLVPGDTNRLEDVFVRDRVAGTTERVNVSNTGAQAIDQRVGMFGPEGTFSASISGNGRYVSFYTHASNLVPGDVLETYDTFVRDRVAGTTARMSTGSTDTMITDSDFHGTFVSADGKYVAMPIFNDLYVGDRQSGQRILVSRGNSRAGFGSSADRASSADGRYVVYSNGPVVLKDMQAGTRLTLGVSATPDPVHGDRSYAPSMSVDGNRVAFTSDSASLAPGDTDTDEDVFVYDRSRGSTELVSAAISGEPNGSSGYASISADGRFVAFYSSSTNLVANGAGYSSDIFVRDLQAATTERVSVALGGVPSNNLNLNSSISGDGRYVAFDSYASNLVTGDTNNQPDIFVRDRVAGTTKRISIGAGGLQSNGASSHPAISTDGHYVAFTSVASNLVSGVNNGSAQVFVHDLRTGLTELASEALPGEAIDTAESPSISADGRFIAFTGDANVSALTQVYVRDREARRTVLASVASDGSPANNASYSPSIAADGRRVVFTSDASNLDEADFNSAPDVYVHELQQSNAAVIRINSGGGAYTDSQGRQWSADTGFNTGSVATSSAPVENTADDLLYQSYRWDDTPAPELQYNLAVPNGSYLVKLYFLESNTATARVGARVFDVEMEGTVRIDNLDVYKEAGLNGALVKSATVTVSDGQLNILLRHQVKNPIVSAIEVIAQSPDDGVSIRTNAGGGAYTDRLGQTWLADTGSNTGSIATSAAPIAGTDDDSLYQSIRWDDSPAPELQYSYSVPNGNYTVRLYFAESNKKTARNGARVFDVDIEGIRRFDGIDVYAQAGGLNTALVKSADVSVADGQMNIVFRHRVKNPIVSAIEIVRK